MYTFVKAKPTEQMKVCKNVNKLILRKILLFISYISKEICKHEVKVSVVHLSIYSYNLSYSYRPLNEATFDKIINRGNKFSSSKCTA